MSVVQPRGAMANKSVTAIRGPQRFKASMVAHSGIDPLGAFGAFTKHDPIKNIDVKREEKLPVDLKKDFPWMQNRIPIGTKTFTYETGKLARNGTLDRTNIKITEGPRSKTDHVSYNPPSSNNPQQKVYDQLVTKPRFAKNAQSSVQWMPYDVAKKYDKDQSMKNTLPVSQRSSQAPPLSQRSHLSQRSNLNSRTFVSQRSTQSIKPPPTVNNRSSVHHNIITGQANEFSYNVKPGLLDKQVNNRKLGITEIRDMAGPNKVHAHPDYQKAFQQDPTNFRRQNGIFTHLYNAAARFGETEVFKC